MKNYRSNSDCEQKRQKRPSESSPSSPKIGMIASPSDTSDLHPTPTALLVSPTGERFTCTLDSLNNASDLNNTNPFSGTCQNESVHKDSESDIDCVRKCPSKKETFRQKKRRKIQVKDRRKADRIILSPRCFIKSKQLKCASIQTDEDNSFLHLNCFPECIGDGSGRELSRSGVDFMSSTITKTSKDGQISSIDNFFAQYLSESLRISTSFLLMIIFIFWITSMILEVDIPAEFIRIASNYVRSFKWGYYQKEPRSFVEKCWDYIKNIFK